ncbi:hypothetical protein EV421DRAFT_2021091 [Armillaria borealis]|uniref:Uncharacterized protein n=1 Tax=Armillaria borealis TaxID=47425 RepID=A0AA39J9Z0_9AGAR|nr:hypothetical protein EV421DRAFT_2021091 [Armillaria borealis]
MYLPSPRSGSLPCLAAHFFLPARCTSSQKWFLSSFWGLKAVFLQDFFQLAPWIALLVKTRGAICGGYPSTTDNHLATSGRANAQIDGQRDSLGQGMERIMGGKISRDLPTDSFELLSYTE